MPGPEPLSIKAMTRPTPPVKAFIHFHHIPQPHHKDLPASASTCTELVLSSSKGPSKRLRSLVLSMSKHLRLIIDSVQIVDGHKSNLHRPVAYPRQQKPAVTEATIKISRLCRILVISILSPLLVTRRLLVLMLTRPPSFGERPLRVAGQSILATRGEEPMASPRGIPPGSDGARF